MASPLRPGRRSDRAALRPRVRLARFGAKDVLRDVNLVVPRGKTTVILGGSGAGKTTLLRMLIALDRPTSGHIFVDGQDLVSLNDLELNEVRRKFGMVFQYAALLDSLTVMENVA